MCAQSHVNWLVFMSIANTMVGYKVQNSVYVLHSGWQWLDAFFDSGSIIICFKHRICCCCFTRQLKCVCLCEFLFLFFVYGYFARCHNLKTIAKTRHFLPLMLSFSITAPLWICILLAKKYKRSISSDSVVTCLSVANIYFYFFLLQIIGQKYLPVKISVFSRRCIVSKM